MTSLACIVSPCLRFGQCQLVCLVWIHVPAIGTAVVFFTGGRDPDQLFLLLLLCRLLCGNPGLLGLFCGDSLLFGLLRGDSLLFGQLCGDSRLLGLLCGPFLAIRIQYPALIFPQTSVPALFVSISRNFAPFFSNACFFFLLHFFFILSDSTS